MSNTPATPSRHRLSPAERRLWPTADGSPTTDFTLNGETRVAVAGDWESDIEGTTAALHLLRRTAPDVRTILHLGDLRYAEPTRSRGGRSSAKPFIVALDALLAEHGILRLLLTPGNHEWWQQLHEEFGRHPDRMYRVAHRIWIAPRGFRWELDGATFMSFGGAASLGRGLRSATWSQREVPDALEVAAAAADGDVDVLLLHEAVDAGISTVDAAIRSRRWSADRRLASQRSRELVTELREGVHPRLTFHGHMHVHGSVTLEDGSQVHSLAVVRRSGNLALLRIHDLAVTWLHNPPFSGP